MRPMHWLAANTTDDNWVEGDQDFYNGDSVTFDGTPGSAQTITLGSNVAPGSISFANGATTAYTINSGVGTTITIDSSLNYASHANSTINAIIAGTGSIYKGDNNDGTSDNNVLNLNGANTYSGGTTIEEGRIGIGHEQRPRHRYGDDGRRGWWQSGYQF